MEVWKRHRRAFAPYLEAAGLDLSTAMEDSLFDLLGRKIEINRRLKGLEEFSRNGCRGIEPGDPARSLFYHVFASPHVQPFGIEDKNYPTMADLEVIENCVYGAAFPSV